MFTAPWFVPSRFVPPRLNTSWFTAPSIDHTSRRIVSALAGGVLAMTVVQAARARQRRQTSR